MKVYSVEVGGANYWVLMHEWSIAEFHRLIEEYEGCDYLGEYTEDRVKPIELDEAAQHERHFHDQDQDPPERWSLFEEVQKHTEPTILGCSEW